MSIQFGTEVRTPDYTPQPFYEYGIRDVATMSENYLHQLELPACFRRVDWMRESPRQAGEATTVKVGCERVLWMSASNSVSRTQAKGRDEDAKGRKIFVEAVAVVELLLRLRQHFKAWNDVEDAKQRGSQQKEAQMLASKEDESTEEKDLDNVAPCEPTIKKTVLVISPYKNQLERIEELLKPYRSAVEMYLSLEIRTTDSSQGREAQIAIVSLVRNQDLEFMRGYPARSLVSMSRSRDYLFLLACHETFRTDDTWGDIIENADGTQLPCLELAWTTTEAAEKTRDKLGQCRLGWIDLGAVDRVSDVRDDDL